MFEYACGDQRMQRRMEATAERVARPEHVLDVEERPILEDAEGMAELKGSNIPVGPISKSIT